MDGDILCSDSDQNNAVKLFQLEFVTVSILWHFCFNYCCWLHGTVTVQSQSKLTITFASTSNKNMMEKSRMYIQIQQRLGDTTEVSI